MSDKGRTLKEVVINEITALDKLVVGVAENYKRATPEEMKAMTEAASIIQGYFLKWPYYPKCTSASSSKDKSLTNSK